MNAKINYAKSELGNLKAQIASRQVSLGQISTAINQAEGLLTARETLGEEPVRSNIAAKYTALAAAVDAVNSSSLSIPTQADFMEGYDAAVDPE